MVKTKKASVFVTALVICATITAPVFAQQAEIEENAIIAEAVDTDIFEHEEPEDSAEDNVMEEETLSAEPSDDEQMTENSLTADEAEFHSDLEGDWYKWDETNGILTLRGQLPDTSYNNSFAKIIGVDWLDVNKIVIEEGTKAGSSLDYAFSPANGKNDFESNVESIEGLPNLDTSSVKRMCGTFHGCHKVKTFDIKSWDTSNVTNMANMFCFCQSMESLDLSGLDTSNVTIMNSIFLGCSSMKSLDLTGFNTENVSDMSGMFYWCDSIDNVDFSSFDTRNVQDMTSMFYSSGFTSLDLSSFDTSNVTLMQQMFGDCMRLNSVNLSSFDTSRVYTMGAMFEGCYSLMSLDLSSFDTRNVAEMGCMFMNCRDLIVITVSGKWTVENVTTSGQMFENCYMLTGANDTVYDSSKTDKEYARIDEEGKPGYLTFRGVYKPTVVIKTAFGGKTVQFNCINSGAEIYYQTSSSNITLNSKHVKAGETVFFNEPMTGADAAIYFKAYDNGKWSSVGKWGLLNVKIDKPIITQSGPKSENNFKIYTQTKDSYIVYTLDGTTPSIEEGTQKLRVTNGRIIWGTSGVVNVPKGKTVKAIAIRCGLVTSDVMTYTNK